MARKKTEAKIDSSKVKPSTHADFWVGLIEPFNSLVDKERVESSDWDPAEDLKDEVRAAQAKAIFAELCAMAQGLQDGDADYNDINTTMDNTCSHARLDQLAK